MTLKDFFVAGPCDDGSGVTGHYDEVASPDPGRPQVWANTDRISYAPGEDWSCTRCPAPRLLGWKSCATD